MASVVFLDSTVLVSADDASAGPKRDTARNLIRKHVGDGTAVVSLQVVQEYYAVATRGCPGGSGSGTSPDFIRGESRVF